MTASAPHIAVLTGDLVHSSTMDERDIDRAFSALKTSAQRQETWHGAPLHFTRMSGDAFQVVLARPELALRSALAFRAALKAENPDFDAYLAVAEGAHEGPVGEDLNAETGRLFVASGRDIGTMKQARADWRMLHDGKDKGIGAAFVLADHISQGWTRAQADAMLRRLDPDTPTLTDIATELGKSHQTVAKSLKAAGIEALTLALTYLEEPETPA